MASFYIRASVLKDLIVSFEKDHLDVLSLNILEADDDPEYGGPSSLWIQGANSSAHDNIAYEESIDSDESLSEFF